MTRRGNYVYNQLSAISYQLSAISYQLSAISYQAYSNFKNFSKNFILIALAVFTLAGAAHAANVILRVGYGDAVAITAVKEEYRRKQLMKMKKRFFGILLSLVMVLGLMPGMSLVALASDATNWTATDSLPTNAGNYKLTANVSISSTWTVPTGTTTLDLNGYAVTMSGDDSVITVGSGATLTIQDSSGSATGSISGGKGKTVGNTKYGGGVYVDGGTLTMTGGSIQGNTANGSASGYGGGVYLNGGSFTLTGGEIKNNTVGGQADGYGGGVGCGGSSTFEMSGSASISGNATNSSGIGGGVFLSGSTFTMKGGTITGNTANQYNGVLINLGSTLNRQGGTIVGDIGTSYGGGSIKYGVIFNANGHGAAPEVQNVALGDKATKPADPTDAGYVFGGWYKEAGCTNAWNFDSDTVNGVTNLYAKWNETISYVVTFKVVNGKWDDDSTADKTVTLTGYEGDTLKLAANQIPAVGIKPNDTYKAGSWDVTPSTETAITEATTYTYTYAAKEASVVTKAPEAKTLTYNGSAQELVTAGTATGGTMQYALGTATEATQPYTTSIPTGTDVGTYTVYYKVIGDANHNDTEAQSVSVEIKSKPSPAPTPEPAPEPTPEPEPEPEPEQKSIIIGTESSADAATVSDYIEGKTEEQLQSVTELKAENMSSLTDLSGFEKLTNLETLNIKNAENLTDISAVKELENLKTIDVSGCTALGNANLSGMKNLTEVSANGCESLSELDVKGCDNLKKVDISGCKSLENADLSSLQNLTEVSAKGCESLSELDVSNCESLTSLDCSESGIDTLKTDGCVKLANLDCHENSLTQLDADKNSLPNLNSLICYGQMRFNIELDASSAGYALDLQQYVSEKSLSASKILSAVKTSSLSKVLSVKAYDANGKELAASFDEITGVISFDSRPHLITYDYNTGFISSESADVLMDVALYMTDEQEDTPATNETSSHGSSSGCNVNNFGLLALALALAKRCRRK